MSDHNYYIYDLETLENCFLFTGKQYGSSVYDIFEISDRVNDKQRLLEHLKYLQNLGVLMVGFNSLGFDYPILHELLVNPYTFDAHKAYLMAQQIIGSQQYGQNPNSIRMSDRIIPQLDLVKVNHFDNANRRVSLKSLQFAMRAPSVEDLPFPMRRLTSDEMEVLRKYNAHDVLETERFLTKCLHLIQMRQELLDNGVLSGDVLNYSDVKIGVEYLIKRIGRQKCFISGSKPRQTFRESVPFKSVILPKTRYRTDNFEKVLDWFNSQTIYIKGEERPNLETKLAGLDFYFGVGGVHASVENRYYESNETHVIKDIDVSGMYVAVATANGFAPEHLGHDFSQAYRQLEKDRKQYLKGQTMNKTLKLAGNGVYGNSNNPYSVFYDPKYTFSVTVNGQLQLLQLVEVLSLIPGLEIIQANTDGITALVPRQVEQLFNLWIRDWEIQTSLKLEEVEYSRMWIRDVNNYLALKSDGEVKRKGAYWYPTCEKDYDGVWNKDFSMMCVQKGIEQVLVNGYTPEDIIRLMSDPFDFMLRYKTPSGAKVYLGDKEMSKTVRYYVSKTGQPMKKVATPKGEIGTFKRKNKLTDEFYNKTLSEIPKGTWDTRIHTGNKSKYESVTTSIESSWLVKECNVASKFNWSDVNYDYYANEIRKLVINGSEL